MHQLVRVESGATTRNGPGALSWIKLQMKAITWTVLPIANMSVVHSPSIRSLTETHLVGQNAVETDLV